MLGINDLRPSFIRQGHFHNIHYEILLYVRLLHKNDVAFHM